VPASIDSLREKVRGDVITAADAAYEQARQVYNGMIQRHPLVVVRCRDASDVMATVAFAREAGVDLSVRGGSHSVPGYGTNDGGVVCDLSPMRAVRVDPASRTARAEGGATWGDFNHATYPFGLATTGGIVSTTGIGGLTLGGGIGYLARGHGLTIDNLISADVVTADGRMLMASEADHEDLFWALRGGGGNFGVVTSFEYRLHPVKDVLVGIFFYPLDHARAVLQFYREFITTAPEELGAFAGFQIAPPLPFIAEAQHGKPFSVMVASWAGSLEEGEKALEPIRRIAPTVAELVTPLPYPALNALFDPLLPAGLQHYWKGAFAKELTDGAIEAHLSHGPEVPVVNSTMHIYSINGACHRIATEASAFPFRDATFATVIAGMWPDPADNDKHTAWVRDYYRALAPHSEAGGYVNFMAADDQDRVRDNYRHHYDRLAGIKEAYDPGNVFRSNQNIAPVPAAASLRS
jgi:FAD/FMN-containing dehydrogenase